MRHLLVAAVATLLLLTACTRSASPTGASGGAGAAEDSGSSALDGCSEESRDGARVWSCGEAFLAMDASEPPATPAEVDDNVAKFAEVFEGHVTQRDEAPWVQDGASHRALRMRVELPEKGSFVATIVVVVRPDRTRVLTCSAKVVDAARCEAVLRRLVAQATGA